MELTEDEINNKYAKHCGHCCRNMLLPNKHEWTCFGCGYNVIKQKNQLSKFQRKRKNFKNRLKRAEHKVLCICKKVYKIYKNAYLDKIYEVLSTLKSKKLKINKISIKK